jgi:hypothetical protein
MPRSSGGRVTAGQILGISRTASYQLARTGQFPVSVIHHGHRYIVPVAPILRLLTPAIREDHATEGAFVITYVL